MIIIVISRVFLILCDYAFLAFSINCICVSIDTSYGAVNVCQLSTAPVMLVVIWLSWVLLCLFGMVCRLMLTQCG